MSLDLEISVVHRAVDLEGYLDWLNDFTQSEIEHDEPFPDLTLKNVDLNLDKLIDAKAGFIIANLHANSEKERILKLIQNDYLKRRKKVFPFYFNTLFRGLQTLHPELEEFACFIYEPQREYGSKYDEVKIEEIKELNFGTFLIYGFETVQKKRLFRRSIVMRGKGVSFNHINIIPLTSDFNASGYYSAEKVSDYLGYKLDDLFGLFRYKERTFHITHSRYNGGFNSDFGISHELRVIHNLVLPYVRKRFSSALVVIDDGPDGSL